MTRKSADGKWKPKETRKPVYFYAYVCLKVHRHRERLMGGKNRVL